MANVQDGLTLDAGSFFNETQVKLFNSMHRLSGLNVCGSIDTPQLIVVGAQSSGKSSVLEALVRFHFPVDSNKPTTRFPINLVLRKSDREETVVHIRPDHARSDDDKERFGRLARELSNITNLEDIMHKAKAVLEVSANDALGNARDNHQTFCKDVLVIERHGPSLPNLSLIDLPGLFHATSGGLTVADRDMIKNMVSEYINGPRNIVLIVISAEVKDYNTVPALGMVQDMMGTDPSLQSRTVCVITCPDATASKEEMLKMLAKGHKFSQDFTRPWHVLRNQDNEARKNRQSLAERDLVEERFFAGLDWETVPQGQKGISALRGTLRSMIWSHTQDQLPSIVSDIRIGIGKAKAHLDATGQAKATPEARKSYLGYIADRFALLARQAVGGNYEKEQCAVDHGTEIECRDCKNFFAHFGDNSLESQRKRLRGNVRVLNQNFADTMRRYGKATVVVDPEKETTTALPMTSQLQQARERSFQPHGTAEYYTHKEPTAITRNDYETWVHENMVRVAAKGPQGEPSDSAYAGLFAHQAGNWSNIATQHLNAVWLIVGDFTNLALDDACPDGEVLIELRHRLVNPNIERLKRKARDSLRDLVTCHLQSHSGFYDSVVEVSAMRERAKVLLQRLATMKLEPEESPEAAAGGGTSGTEQAGSQQTNGNTPKSKVQQSTSVRGRDHRARERNLKNREETLTYALESVTTILGSGYPILGNTIVREQVVPIIARQIAGMFDGEGDAGTKEKARRTGPSYQKVVHGLYPSDSTNLSAARVIEEVEMNYEVRYHKPVPNFSRTFLGVYHIWLCAHYPTGNPGCLYQLRPSSGHRAKDHGKNRNKCADQGHY